jgi:hypothetical protein
MPLSQQPPATASFNIDINGFKKKKIYNKNPYLGSIFRMDGLTFFLRHSRENAGIFAGL